MHAVESYYAKLMQFLKLKLQEPSFHGSVVMEVKITAGRIHLVRIATEENIKPKETA